MAEGDAYGVLPNKIALLARLAMNDVYGKTLLILINLKYQMS